MHPSAAVESTGAAKAEAQSKAEAARIHGEAAVEEAKLKAEAQKIEAVCHPKCARSHLYPFSPYWILTIFHSSVCQDSELARLCKAREQELNYKKETDRMEVEKRQKLAEIESLRFKQLIENLGADTLKEMARAGPELQVSELKNFEMAN